MTAVLDLTKIKRSPMFRIVLAQVVATLIFSALGLMWDVLLVDTAAALSALAAGAVCVVPGLYVVAISMREIPAGDTGFGLALKAETARFLLSAAGFGLVFVFVSPLNAVVFFGVFLALQAVNILIPVRDAQRLRRRV